jgi:tetratricopeptide (TPR) repeat protein
VGNVLGVLERRLSALGFDGVEMNTRCLLKTPTRGLGAYRGILAELDAAPAAEPERARRRALVGKTLSILEDYPGAERALRRSLALDRRDARTWVWLGETLLLRARVGEARRAFDSALRLDSRCAWAYFFRAAADSIEGADTARDDLRRLKKLRGEGAAREAALVLTCLTEAASGRFESAERFLERLSRGKLSPARLRALARAIRGLAAARAKAVEPAEVGRASVLEPAIALLRGGKIGPALRRARIEARILLAAAPSIDVKLELFRLQILALDFENAGLTADWILERTREYRHLHQLNRPFFGKEFDFMSLPDRYIRKAAAAMNLHAAKRPNSPWGYYWRDVFNETAGLRRAGSDSEDIRGISRLPKRYGWMRSHTGYYYLFREDFRRAIGEFEAAVRATVPGDWASQCFIGEALACLGDLRGAMSAFRAAGKLAPKGQSGAVLAWKGAVLLWSGDYPRALRAAQAAAEKGATFADCWKGGSMIKLGRFEEAIAPLRRAIELTPHDAEARGWLAEAYFRLGRLKDALREADVAETKYRRYCSFHLSALRGLVRSALGDAAGMRRDFNEIPARIVDSLNRKKAFDTATDDGARKALTYLLDVSRGVRRGSYENRIWMGLAADEMLD